MEAVGGDAGACQAGCQLGREQDVGELRLAVAPQAPVGTFGVEIVERNLKLQAIFTGTICKRFYTANISVATTIKYHSSYTFVFGTFSNLLAYQFGLLSLFHILQLLT